MMRAALFFCIALVSIEAQNADWVFLEKGWESLRQRKLTEALQYFREARSMRDLYPEADFGMGLVYAAELNYALALRQYDLALSSDAPFQRPDYRYLVHYQRAKIAWIQQDFLSFEENLLHISDAEAQFSDPEQNWIRRSLMRSAQSSSFERLLVLYRLDSTFAFAAHRELGIYLVRSGRDSALDHMLFAYVHVATKLITALQEHIPDYVYTTLTELIEQSNDFPHIVQYREESGFFRILYHLALAYRLYDAASSESRAIFQFLLTQENEWATHAAAQLETPFFPLLADFYPQFPPAY